MRVIKHAMGGTEIKGTPERVVVLYSVYVGDVRALGVQPIGTVNLDFINGWLTPLGYPLSEDVVNVGTPDEPNFEIVPGPKDTSDKWYRTGMEGLTTVDGPDVHLFLTYNAGQYDSNLLERSTLDAVKDGRAHDIGNTRLFNQIIFAEDIVSRVVDALTDGVTETNTSILYDTIAAAIVAGS